MANLNFVDQHNMVACLERTDGNVEFHQIVDFLTTSPIHYALTISPTIYASYIEQFWATAKSKIVNDVKQIHATVDGKKDDIKIPQSSGPPKKVGDESVYTGEDDRVVKGTGSGSGPRRHDTTLGDTDAQTRFETASKQSHDPPLSEVNTSGSGEDSMEHHDDLTDFVPPTPHDSPLLRGHTPGSDEGRPNINELMAICTQLSNKVLALEQSKTAQDLVIKKLQKKVKRLEKKHRARTPGMNLFKIATSRRKSDFDDDFDDIDDMVDKAMKYVEGDTVNAGGVVNLATIGLVVATPKSIQSISAEKRLRIQYDKRLALRLHEEEKAELERMKRDRSALEEASNATLNVKFDDV
ncbi:hypothetical protein Tco_0405608 [Tanacetum coccineum]